MFLLKRNVKICLFLCLSGIGLFGQNATIIQLQNKLERAGLDTAKVNVLNDLAWEFRRIDFEQTYDYACQANELSKTLHYQAGASKANNLMGLAYSFRGESKAALAVNEKALQLAREVRDSHCISEALNDIAVLLSEKADYGGALEKYHESLNYCRGNDALGLVITLTNLGTLHEEMGNEKKATEYFFEANKEAFNSNDSLAICEAQLNLSDYYYYYQDNLDSSLFYLNKALEIAQRRHDIFVITDCLTQKGVVESEKGNFALALDYQLKVEKILNDLGSKNLLAYHLLELGYTYCDKKDFRHAVQMASKGLELVQEIGLNNLVADYYELLSQAHAGDKNYEKAFHFQRLLTEKKDSLSNNETQLKLAEIETDYQVKKKETENLLLKVQQAKNEASIQKQNISLAAILIILALVLVSVLLLLRANRQKQTYNVMLENQVNEKTAALQKSNEILRQTNEELERFTHIASHDLKEPIRNIAGFTNLIQRRMKQNNDPALAEYLGFIEKNANQLYNLIEDVLEYSRINQHSHKAKEKVDIQSLVSQVEDLLKFNIRKKNVLIRCRSLPRIVTNKTKLMVVLKNLIENGIKYNQNPKPVIEISYQRQGQFHHFSIRDNGIGISSEYFRQIFGMFKRLHTREVYEGSGMGLAICKKIIHQLGGNIEVESVVGEGSAFTFSLPVETLQPATSNKLRQAV